MSLIAQVSYTPCFRFLCSTMEIHMLKRFNFLAVAVASFLPESVGNFVKPKTEVKMRHLTVVNPPKGFPRHIEWDANDAQSCAVALKKMDELKNLDSRRAYFKEAGPDEIGQRLRNPGTEENVVSIPEIYAG
jgi:hypothetical protein